MKKLFSLFALFLLLAQGARAEIVGVALEWHLRYAIGRTSNIMLEDDIVLTEGRLDINGENVTIDLNGHKLSRPMSAADDGGQVIAIMNGGNLTITDSSGNCGQITGGWSYQGGAIYVYEGCQLTINGGTITGNRADQKGGGYGYGGAIENHGTLTITGGIITGNSATWGGGIYNVGTLNMQGKPVIKDNGSSNVYLPQYQFITVTGAFAAGTSVGLSTEALHHITLNYNTYNEGIAPDQYFFSDNTKGFTIALNTDGEVIHGVKYIKRAWDDEAKQVTETWQVCTDYTAITYASGDLPSKGDYDDASWYVVRGNVTCANMLNAQGDINLILCDGATLNANGSFNVERSKAPRTGAPYIINIYGQADNSGRMTSVAAGLRSGIGSGSGDCEFYLHGGNVTVSGSSNGSWSDNNGYYSGLGAYKVGIYSGTLNATGGAYGPGIGRSNHSINYSGDLNIYGGTVIAQGGTHCPGISCESSYSSSGYNSINIYGGTVSARGGEYAAGIGSKEGQHQSSTVNIYGGNVTAQGGMDAAGIGGGESGNGGTVNIYGGTVLAHGYDLGAGIGGGQDGKGGNVHILGGSVTAKAGSESGTGHRAIGPGSGSDDYGTLEIGNSMMVRAGSSTGTTLFPANERVVACFYRVNAYIDPCTHNGVTYTYQNADTHTFQCYYCTTTSEAHYDHADGKCICGYILPIPGDVDNNHELGLADITALLNIILHKDDAEPHSYNHANADVNGDGDIDLDDVNALVDTILK